MSIFYEHRLKTIPTKTTPLTDDNHGFSLLQLYRLALVTAKEICSSLVDYLLKDISKIQ